MQYCTAVTVTKKTTISLVYLNTIHTHQTVIQSQRFLQVRFRLIGRNEIRKQQRVKRRIGWEKQVVIRLKLVDGLQHSQTELLLAWIQSRFSSRGWIDVVVGGKALLKGRRHEDQGKTKQKLSHGCCCRHSWTVNEEMMRVGSACMRRKWPSVVKILSRWVNRMTCVCGRRSGCARGYVNYWK